MSDNKLFKKARKLLVVLGCLFTLTLGWVSGIASVNAATLSDYQTLAQLGSYGRGGEVDRDAKRTLREENGTAKPNFFRNERNANAEKSPPGYSAKTDNSKDANSIHGRERLEVGRIQAAMDDSKEKSQGIVKTITDKLSGDK